jgi:hypothetical protein
LREFLRENSRPPPPPPNILYLWLAGWLVMVAGSEFDETRGYRIAR